jgi:hypothetical protein
MEAGMKPAVMSTLLRPILAQLEALETIATSEDGLNNRQVNALEIAVNGVQEAVEVLTP